MVGPSELIHRIESYVDTSRSPSQQAASLNSIVTLVKSDFLTIQVLVKEMRMYLSTTDNVIRARGVFCSMFRRCFAMPFSAPSQ